MRCIFSIQRAASPVAFAHERSDDPRWRGVLDVRHDPRVVFEGSCRARGLSTAHRLPISAARLQVGTFLPPLTGPLREPTEFARWLPPLLPVRGL